MGCVSVVGSAGILSIGTVKIEKMEKQKYWVLLFVRDMADCNWFWQQIQRDYGTNTIVSNFRFDFALDANKQPKIKTFNLYAA